MGCGISMFNQLEDLATGSTCEFNPLRQNNVHPINRQFDHVDSDRGRKSISSPSKDHKGTHHDVVKDRTHTVIKQIKTRKVMCSENPTEFEKDIPRKDQKVSAGKVAQEDRQVEKDHRRRNNKEDQEKESCHKSWEDSIIGPASPSFKEYCMDSSTSSGCSDDDNDGGAKSEKKSQKEEGPLDSKEGYRSQIGKKYQRKGRGFRSKLLLHKGRRPAGVRFFFNGSSNVPS